MKAEELMLGDWVIGGSGEPFQIGIIDPDFIYWYDIKPIQITPEILELNGFDPNGIPEEDLPIEERDYSDDTYIWSIGSNIDDTRYQVCVYIDYPKDICWFEAFTPDSHIDGIRIKYIHQLQHALKLCNINKEIML